MRFALGVSIIVATCGVLPAQAAPNPTEIVASPLHSAVAKITPVETRVGPDFRIRADLLTTSVSIDPFGDPAGAVRHRFSSSMIDYYPIGGSGLRFSAGMRFFSVNNFLKDAEKATGGLLYNPRLLGSSNGVRTGFNRRTPAATVGYTSAVRNALVGFELGSLIGNANADLPRSMERISNRGRGGMNPIANLVFGLSF